MANTPLQEEYGVWKVLEEIEPSKGHRKVRCQCKNCGAIVDKLLSNIKRPERQGHRCNILPTDLTGYVFGHLTVLGRDETKPKGHGCKTYHICQCDCPDRTIVSVSRSSLIEGRTKSCGSAYHRHQLKGEQISLIGKQFLNLRVDEYTEERASNGDIIYLCTCLTCGKNNIKVSRSTLTSLNKKDCGCTNKSIGEIAVENILKENNIHYETQVSFKDLPKLRFDFKIYLNENNFVLLEYDGIQHFNKNSLYYSNEGIERDKMKNEWCLKNNIVLYRIPYTDLKNLSINTIFSEKYQLKQNQEEFN